MQSHTVFEKTFSGSGGQMHHNDSQGIQEFTVSSVVYSEKLATKPYFGGFLVRHINPELASVPAFLHFSYRTPPQHHLMSGVQVWPGIQTCKPQGAGAEFMNSITTSLGRPHKILFFKDNNIEEGWWVLILLVHLILGKDTHSH